MCFIIMNISNQTLFNIKINYIETLSANEVV